MKVGDILRMLQSDGWYLVATRGSHRQFKHAVKPGRVTGPGKPSADHAPGTLNSIFKQAGLKSGGSMRYAIVIEKAEGNYSAYVPDLPGCVATGLTVAEVEAEIRQAIVFHVEGLRQDGLAIPAAESQVDYVDVTA